MRSFALLVIGVALGSLVRAQCSTFANNPPGTDLLLGDEDVRTVGLEFAFPFAGQTWSTISVASNGFVWLGTVTPDQFLNVATDYFDNEPALLAWEPRIALCWDDWDPSSAPIGGGVFFRGDATQASIVWKNVPSYSSPVFANMELVLGASGTIDLHFDNSMGVPQDSAIVGISAGRGAAPNALAWSTFAPGVLGNATGYELVPAGGFALAGQTLHFAPVVPNATQHLVTPGALATCAPAALPPLATFPLRSGTGCPPLATANASAIYEVFTPTGGLNAPDLSHQSITFQRFGSTYLAGPGPGFDSSYLTHGTLLPQEDETVARNLGVGPMGAFPFANLQVAAVDAASNGYLLLQPGGDSEWLPTPTDLVTGRARIAPHWTDLDLYTQGSFYWSNDDPNFCMATWVNAEEFALPTVTNTFQCKLWANGDITFSYGVVGSLLDNILVGFSLGNGAADPGAIDTSNAANTGLTRNIGTMVLPLLHRASGPASIRTEFKLRAENLPVGTAVGAFVISSTSQSVDLTSVGMPSCTAYVGLDDLFVEFTSGAAFEHGFLVPGIASFLGATLHSQAIAFAPVNAFGVITSNRVTFTIGL